MIKKQSNNSNNEIILHCLQCLKDYYTMINVTNIVLLTLKETLMANLIKVNKERTSTTFFFVNFFSINCINLFSFFILSSL
ncbi:hypothetical protein DLD54_00365 [Lactobacillus helsingborgensis]|nr:hypothetical protein DLD54_00365 [Lactobacillus helsingborgensis]RMC54824.1 hypothetical protein F5ESL0262_00365 [Lactobacillus sp. ESL0262]